MSLTDAEIIELEKLVREQEIDERFGMLIDPTEASSPNYIFLHQSITEQQYDKGQLVSGYRGCVLEGSSRCFSPNQLVVTKSGSVPISQIKSGQLVKTFNEQTGRIEFKPVVSRIKFKNTKKTVRIKLKTGSVIECTEDHEFYYKGAWRSVKHLLSLWDDSKDKH